MLDRAVVIDMSAVELSRFFETLRQRAPDLVLSVEVRAAVPESVDALLGAYGLGFRQKVANREQSLNLLLALVEANPEKASEAAKRTRELREKQEGQESAEKTAINAAKIVAAGPAK